jgi:hypothetical protein
MTIVQAGSYAIEYWMYAEEAHRHVSANAAGERAPPG